MTIEVPEDLFELLKNPQQVRDIIATVKALKEMNFVLTTPANNLPFVPGQMNVIGDPPNLMVAVPLKIAGAIADPTGGATVDTQARAQLASLLAALRILGMLPP